MKTQTTPAPRTTRNIAIVAGIGYLMIFLSGIFANFFVIEEIFQPDDTLSTLQLLQEQSSLFRTGILSFIVMVLFDVLLTWALYILFKPVHAHISALAGLFRLVNATIFGVAIFHLLDISSMIHSAEYMRVFTTDQLAADIMRSYHAFNHTWLVGLLFFGIHLIGLGYLLIRSRQTPSWIGIALLVAAAGYLTDSIAQFIFPGYPAYQDVFMAIVVVPGVLGELSLTFWLLLRGGRKENMVQTPDTTTELHTNG